MQTSEAAGKPVDLGCCTAIILQYSARAGWQSGGAETATVKEGVLGGVDGRNGWRDWVLGSVVPDISQTVLGVQHAGNDGWNWSTARALQAYSNHAG